MVKTYPVGAQHVVLESMYLVDFEMSILNHHLCELHDVVAQDTLGFTILARDALFFTVLLTSVGSIS